MDEVAKYKKLIGTRVKVVVDRKLGSPHPKYSTIYEVNYGYLEDTIAGDGHEIDAYVIGPIGPIDLFEGHCVAVIVRKNDTEHKLIVSDQSLLETEIRNKTFFIEKYFDSQIMF